MTDDDLAELATEHAVVGLPSLPVVLIQNDDGTTGKRPVTRGGHGYLDATLDGEEFRLDVEFARGVGARLADGRPWCLGVGVVPGEGGAIVLDCDVKRGARGLETLTRLKASYGEEIGRVCFRSISGGLNVILGKPERPIGNATPHDWVGVDVRADCGFVVAPGTRTPWGEWVWEHGEWADLVPMPDEMAALLPDGDGSGNHQLADRGEVLAFLAASPRSSAPAAADAFKQKLAELKATTSGNRHPALVYVVSWTLGMEALNLDQAMVEIDTVWGGLLRPDEARSRSDEAWKVARWVLPQEQANRDAQSAPPGADDSTHPSEWSDAHVGEAFARHLGDEWCYVTLWRRWLRWDGRRWSEDRTEAVHEEARHWVIELGVEVMSTPGNNADLVKRVVRYKGRSAMESIVKVASRILAVEPSVFDTHAHLLNAKNGVIDLRTGELHPHDPLLMLTKVTGADYDPNSTHCDVESMLSCMTTHVRSSMRQLLGAAAAGETGDDLLAVFDGSGANGKTTLLLAASGALGDYASPIPAPLVMSTGRDEHPHLYETIRGVRLAFIEETEEDGGLRQERVKALTGGAPISARPMGGSYYTFEPTHTLVIATNHRPIVNSAEHAIWRRLRLIPFPYTYGNEAGQRRSDPGLRDRISKGGDQRAAMLAWIVNGAVQAYKNGDGRLPVVGWCDEILNATAEWRAAEDAIGRFIAERIEVAADPKASRSKGTEIFEAYKEWCQQEGRPSGQAKNFHRKFAAHEKIGEQRRTNRQNATWYLGVTVRPYCSAI